MRGTCWHVVKSSINREYYTVARRYEVYLRVETMFHGWAQRTSEIFFPREDKLHFFKPTCNFIFITKIWMFRKLKKKNWTKNKGKTKEWRQQIFTSEDMENISLVSQMYFSMENTSCLFFGKTLIFM